MRNTIRSKEGVYSYASLLMPHCPVTVVQRYRMGYAASCSTARAVYRVFFEPVSEPISTTVFSGGLPPSDCSYNTICETSIKNISPK